ncbi:MAG TPA: phosphate ABC transporter permease PstA [Candidatus Limnocylindrales bacterium]|nr:phosphate ABC transporter permease PstA [Candidatus Limnocylindrales bacterium]
MSTATSVAAGTVTASLRRQRLDVAGWVFSVILLVCLLFSLALLIVLVSDQLIRGLPVFAERGTTVLTSPLSSSPARAGLVQGLIGSALLAVIVALTAFPVGILTAVYLEEYASGGRLSRFIDVNIRNLSGVPSVVYGLLGLAVFVALMSNVGNSNGANIITGGLTLAVLILPLVIITSAEAIRAVPNAIREAGFGIGASRWQVVRKLVLPAATPGVLTGTVLALSRALGETAPLILIGAVLGSFSQGRSIQDLFLGSYTALPVIVFDWARKPQEEFRALTSAAIIVLLLVTVIANAFAIILRNRYERRW